MNKLQRPCKTEYIVQKYNMIKELIEEQLVQSSRTQLYITYPYDFRDEELLPLLCYFHHYSPWDQVVGVNSFVVFQSKKQEPIVVESNVEMWKKRLKTILHVALQ